MPARNAAAARSRRPFPLPPDLAAELGPAPSRLAAGDIWDQVSADGTVEVDDVAADVDLREVVWSGAQLVGRRFPNLTCADVLFEGGDLAGVAFDECELTRVTFRSCRMTGAIFAGARLREVYFEDCVANLADFRMAQVRRSAADRTSLREADFYGSTLVDVRLAGSDLRAANFDTAKPERLDLRTSTVEALRGVAQLSGTRVDADQLLPLGASLVSDLGLVLD